MTCRSMVSAFSAKDRRERTRFEQSANVGGETECRTFRERCRGSGAERFAGNEAVEKNRAAGWKLPDFHLQGGPCQQGVLRLNKLDTTGRAAAAIGGENSDRRKT